LTKSKGEIFNYGLNSFLSEARIIAKFKHPSIIRILCYFKQNNTAYIVMEYEKGQTLRAYIKNGGDISETCLLGIFHSINSGLSLLHNYKDKEITHYIHRDITPDNIIIREDNTPVLIDFSTVRDISTSGEVTRIFTKYYSPFEQCDSRWASQGPWTDIYALGATLYFAVTATHIPAAESRAFNDHYKALKDSHYTGQYSTHFLYAIDKAVELHPNNRPQDLIEWNKALKSNIYLIESDNTVYSNSSKINNTVYSNANETDNTVYSYHSNKDDNTVYPRYSKSRMQSTLVKKIPNLLPYRKPFILIVSIFVSLTIIGVYYNPQTNKLITPIEPIFELTPDNIISNDIDKEIQSIKIYLQKENLNFDSLVKLSNNINRKMSEVFYPPLRTIYLNVLQRSLEKIPHENLQNKHNNWLYKQKNNIEKDKKGNYHIKESVKELILNKKYLYGSLKIISPMVSLMIEIIDEKSVCRQQHPCMTPVKQGHIRIGKKTILLYNKNANINYKEVINIHPNQHYVIYKR
jgi:serine/threonine protein kinase